MIADETGACFVPQRLIDQVLQMAEAVTEQERSYMRQLENGLSIRDFARIFTDAATDRGLLNKVEETTNVEAS